MGQATSIQSQMEGASRDPDWYNAEGEESSDFQDWWKTSTDAIQPSLRRPESPNLIYLTNQHGFRSLRLVPQHVNRKPGLRLASEILSAECPTHPPCRLFAAVCKSVYQSAFPTSGNAGVACSEGGSVTDSPTSVVQPWLLVYIGLSFAP
jgi:hypothetical protein